MPYIFKNGELVITDKYILDRNNIPSSSTLCREIINLSNIPSPEHNTHLVCKPTINLILYTGTPTQYKLDLVKFNPIPSVSPPIVIFVAPHLILDIIYKTLPHNLKLLPRPVQLLALPIPDYIIIRVEPSLPEIIYLPGHRIIYLPQPIPVTTYSIATAKSSCKSKYSKSVTVIDYTNNKAAVYNSLGEASRALNVNISVISRRLKTGNTSLYKNRYLITSSVTYSNLLTKPKITQLRNFKTSVPVTY